MEKNEGEVTRKSFFADFLFQQREEYWKGYISVKKQTLNRNVDRCKFYYTFLTRKLLLFIILM